MKVVGRSPKKKCNHEWCDEIKRISITNPNYDHGDAYFLWAWCRKCKQQWIKDYKITRYESIGI